MLEDYRAAARRFSRRSLFATTGLLGLAAAGAAVSAGGNAAVDPEEIGQATAVGINPVIRVERVYSTARRRAREV